MAVSYKKLFKLLIDKNMKKKDLKKLTSLNYSTLAKLENGENVTMKVVEKICTKMNCNVDDIVEFVADTEPVNR